MTSAEPDDASDEIPSFPIVCLGASAGGYDAIRSVLERLGDAPGVAIVIVQHLSPDRASELTGLLQRSTSLPAVQIEAGMPVQPDRVHVIPPGKIASVRDGTFELEPTEEGASPQTIDRMLSSLADEVGHQAVGVLLSGTLTDGVLGLKRIQEAGGQTFVQDPKTAEFPSLPQAALDAGAADFMLAPEEIGEDLADLVERKLTLEDEGDAWDPDALEELFEHLRSKTAVDFSDYKDNTVRRRVHRRIVATGSRTLDGYLELLREDPEEIDRLYKELLILVTEFFREEATLETLKRQALNEIVADKEPGDPIRVWVAGCATGEEAYSLAILLDEYVEANQLDHPIRVFGTDISEEAIETARKGRYAESIESEVSPERLRRYFSNTDGGYQVNEAIRATCVFSIHDLTNDPPFSNIDLASCRNVIIYMKPSLQKHVFSVLHYALDPGGLMLLGSSESPVRGGRLFETAIEGSSVYRARQTGRSMLHDFSGPPGAGVQSLGAQPPEGQRVTEEEVAKEVDRILLDRFSPPAVVVNSDAEVILYRGDTSPYLAHPEGRATHNLVQLAREGLDVELGKLIEDARERREIIKRAGVSFRGEEEEEEEESRVDLEVLPFLTPRSQQRYWVVVFEDPSGDHRGDRFKRATTGIMDRIERMLPTSATQPDRLEELEQELEATRSYLRTVIERYEATNEELRSANEEALSTNEELQSTNEELETAKEEMQATNEELVTLNQELNERNEEVQQINDDLQNLLNSVQLPIVMLDQELRIRRFTSAGSDLFNLLDTDVGRPLTDLNLPVDLDRLKEALLDVLDHLQVEERTITDNEDRELRLKIHPYRTSDDRIEGVVLVVVDPKPANGDDGG